MSLADSINTAKSPFQGAIAKWLRRQIRNLFSFGGAGSNPAGVELFGSFFDVSVVGTPGEQLLWAPRVMTEDV